MHRVDACFAGSVREWGAAKHCRAGDALVAVSRQEHHLLTGLTVAVEHRCLSVMPSHDLLDEGTKCAQDVTRGLSAAGDWEEVGRVDRMAFDEGHADFRIAPKASNTWSVTGTRVDDDNGGCTHPNLSL